MSSLTVQISLGPSVFFSVTFALTPANRLASRFWLSNHTRLYGSATVSGRGGMIVWRREEADVAAEESDDRGVNAPRGSGVAWGRLRLGPPLGNRLLF